MSKEQNKPNFLKAIYHKQLTSKQREGWFYFTLIADVVGLCILPACAVYLLLDGIRGLDAIILRYSDDDKINIALCTFGFMGSLVNQIVYYFFMK